MDKLTLSPLTEATALTLSKSWSNATLRNQYISQWHTFALQRYSDAGTLTIAATVDTVGSLKTQAQNNLYYGLGGGAALGLVLGIVVMVYMGRRRELIAVKK